ncbi:MAG TPA: hypothetical protein VF240_05020 [Pyrinomonadaceae bacterium]
MSRKQLFGVLAAVLMSCFDGRGAHAQSDTPRLEVGAQFSTLEIDDARGLGERREAGFGGRLTYNLGRHFALEAEINYFPRDYRLVTTDFTGGRVIQGLFGPKAGIRGEKFGLFGKVRPGFQSSGRAARARFPNGNGPDPGDPFGFEFFRATQLTLDVGGVFEYYPSRRYVVRFDLGDTITRYPNVEFVLLPAGTPVRETVYSHKVQFSAGFGFRF